MELGAGKEATAAAPPGLRGRKKARRREEILARASALFAEKGIDATTMAEIAEAVGVSTPTIFNYFGNKDGILIALITEGARKARSDDFSHMLRTDRDFATVLADVFTAFAARTLDIASKRVWRYAEAAAIRHPTTELARNYALVDKELVQVIDRILRRYDMRLRSGDAPDFGRLSEVFYHIWNAAFFTLIKDEERTLDQHRAELLGQFRPLARMILEDDFLAAPTLKQARPQHEPS